MWTLAQDISATMTPPNSWAGFFENLTDTGTITMILIFGIPITAIVMGTLKSVLGTQAKERTRQEVAAYVAEGSMSAEEGERLLRAGSSKSD